RERGQRPGGLGLYGLRVALRGPYDDGGHRLVLAEGPLLVDDLGGLGAARQEGGLVVGGDLAELPGVGAERAADAQPGDQQDDGDEPAGSSGGEGHGAPGGVEGSRPD